MVIKKALAGASLLLLAFAVTPAAHAQNDSADGVTTARPHKVVDPAKKAARKAKRQARREARRQARLRQQQAPSAVAPGIN